MKKYRIFYTICFLALCLIDQIIGTSDGRIQFVAINSIGFIIAGIIFTSGNHKLKDFLRVPYAIWTGISLIGGALALYWGMKTYPYKGQWISGVILVIVYGFLVIRSIERIIRTRKALKFKSVPMILWAVMILLMMVTRNESIWPLYFGIMFGCFYLTDFDKEKKKALVGGLVDGIILGFFVIEGQALLFRPFDMPRYYGMYANPNITALFFLVSYVAFLAKWLLMIHKKSPVVLRILVAFLAGAMYGFVLMTGCKTAFFGMALATVLFLIAYVRMKKDKIRYFFAGGALIVLFAIVSVPVTYLAARYCPTIHLHPVYFLNEYNQYYDQKVMSGEPRDSEKYTSFEEMMEENMGRFLFFIYRKGETYELAETDSPEETSEVVVLTPEEEAELNARIEEALIKPGDTAGPFKIRYLVHTYYLKRLNLTGHSYKEDGVPVFVSYHPEHAHNFLLQMSFWFGIPAGLLLIGFIVMAFLSAIRLWKEGENVESFVVAGYLIALLAFGFFEIMWRCGQMSFTLFFFMLYPLFQKAGANEKTIEKAYGE